MEGIEQELRTEIDRLRQLVTLLEQKKWRRTARVEIVMGDFIPIGDNKYRLNFLVTAPGTQDEIEFGKYVASYMSMLVNKMGITKTKFDGATEVPPAEQS